MKIHMTREKFVLVDGLHLERWCKGFDYEARDSVACRLINNGDATIIHNNLQKGE